MPKLGPKRISSYQRRKREIAKQYPDYKAFIASHPCAACGAFPVEVAHVGDRGFSLKCSDRETIPLCYLCHREGPGAQHKLGKFFWEARGLDRLELIKHYQDLYDSQQLKAA